MPKILLVEDNEMNRDMLTRRLQRKGFEVITAVNGADGVQQAYQESPDLILMDMNLPIMDGWEATKQLKADATTQHIPIIAQTAHAMQGDRERCLAVGCDDYTPKPVQWAQLMTKIEAWLY